MSAAARTAPTHPRPAPTAALTALVLAAHLLLIDGLPIDTDVGTPPPSPALRLRAVAAPDERPAPVATRPARQPRPDTWRSASSATPAEPAAVARPASAASAAPTDSATDPTAPAAANAPPAAAAPSPETASETAAPPGAGAALTGTPSVGPLQIPAAATLRYQVDGVARGNTYTARSTLTWQTDGASYAARFELGVFLLGSRVQTSVGAIGADGVMPRRFSDKTRREVAIHFERDKGQVTFSSTTQPAPLLPGMQDRLSLLFQVAALLAGDPARYPAGSSLTLPAVGSRAAEVWRFAVQGDETLTLAGQPVATLKLVRAPRHEHDQTIELWCAPALGYLPVRIRFSQRNGDYVDQQWTGGDP